MRDDEFKNPLGLTPDGFLPDPKKQVPILYRPTYHLPITPDRGRRYAALVNAEKALLTPLMERLAALTRLIPIDDDQFRSIPASHGEQDPENPGFLKYKPYRTERMYLVLNRSEMLHHADRVEWDAIKVVVKEWECFVVHVEVDIQKSKGHLMYARLWENKNRRYVLIGDATRQSSLVPDAIVRIATIYLHEEGILK